MKKNPLMPGWPTIISSLALIALFLFQASCKVEKQHVDTKCVTLERSEIQKWVNNDLTKPGGPNTIAFLMFHTIDWPTREAQVDVYPLKKDSSVISGANSTLTGSTTCFTPLPRNITRGKNYVDITKLGILKPDGTLLPFDFIRLTPQVYATNPLYMQFKIELVTLKDGAEVVEAKAPCDPCPPLCPNDAAAAPPEPVKNE